MDLTKLSLEEVFLLLAFVKETLKETNNKYLLDKQNKLNQEILNRLSKV